jgi:hypothetical protein
MVSRTSGEKASSGRSRLGQLAQQPGLPFVRIDGRGFPRLAGREPPERGERLGRAGGVLAQIKPHGAEPEGLHLAAHRANELIGEVAAAAIPQCAFQRPQIRE